ncbi:MAG: hypothetical protein WC960_06855 [Bacteroidales bacterium]
MMEKRFEINKMGEESGFRKNPFTIPDGYFDTLKESVANKIAYKERFSLWEIIKPQLALISTFAAIFLFGYIAISIVGSKMWGERRDSESGTQLLSQELIEAREFFLEPRTIDFLNEEQFSVSEGEQAPTLEELIAYVEDNFDLVTLSSVEFK